MQECEIRSKHEDLFQVLLDVADQAVYKIERDGTCSFVNHACIRLLGYADKREILGKNMHQLIHHSHADGSPYPEDKCPAYRVLINGVKAHADDSVFWHKDGSSFPAEYWSYPIFADGHITGCIVTFIDISERKKTDEMLRKSQADLAYAQRIAKMGNWEWNLRDNTLNWSDQTYRLIGLEPGSVAPSVEMFNQYIHPEDRPLVEEQLNLAISGGNYRELDYRVITVDGQVRYLHAIPEVEHNARGDPMRLFGAVYDITERKLAELALEEQKERNELILRTTQDGFSVIDLDGNILETNTAFCRMLGYTQEELLAMGLKDIVASQSPEQVKDHLETIVVNGYDREESCYRCKNGERIDVEVSASLMEHGDKKFIASFFRDITNRKQAEKELDYHRKHLEELVAERTEALREKARIIEQIHDAVIATDLEGIITSWNQGAERLFGYSAGEVVGKPITVIYPEEYFDFLHNQVIRPVKEMGEHEIEVATLDKSGKRLIVHLSLSVLYDHKQNIKGIIGYYLNITKRKQTERALIEQEAENQAILSALPDLIFQMSKDGVYLDFHASDVAMLAVPPEKLLGKSVYQIFPKEFADRIMENIHKTLQTKQVTSFEYDLTLSSHDARYFEARLAFIDPERVLSIVRDITARKQAESLLQQRTLELQASNKELEAFSYSVSHDLRTPLRAINGFSQALVEDYEDILDDKGKDFLQRVCAASLHMGELIDDIINLSRVTRRSMRREQVDLSATAHEVVKQLIDSYPDRSVETAIQPNMIVFGDKQLLYVLLQNLLSNTGRACRGWFQFKGPRKSLLC
jgi:PAS domain S-box-containing protein